jgi:hypothetical protein
MSLQRTNNFRRVNTFIDGPQWASSAPATIIKPIAA